MDHIGDQTIIWVIKGDTSSLDHEPLINTRVIKGDAWSLDYKP